MKTVYQVDQQLIEVVFAEALPVVLNREALFFKNRTILLVTNQVYYDNYYDIFSSVMKQAKNVYWYVCPNTPQSNQFSELKDLLQFISEIDFPNETQLIGFGNSGIYYLCNFLASNRSEILDWSYIATDLQAFQASLSGKGIIELSYDKIGLSTSYSPKKIYFDSTITIAETIDFRLYELIALLRIGIISDYQFLQELGNVYRGQEQLWKLNFGPMLPTMIKNSEKSPVLLVDYAEAFRQGVRHTPGSHLLSSLTKQIISLVLHLSVSQQLNHFPFQIENFFKWLLKLGYELEIPNELLTTDLAESIWQELRKQPDSYFVKEIGEAALQEAPSQLLLSEAIGVYRERIKEIKETIV